MQRKFFLSIFFVAFLFSGILGISVLIEVTHEEHFESSDIEERDVIQISNKKLREDILHDEDILKFEKSQEKRTAGKSPSTQSNTEVKLDTHGYVRESTTLSQKFIPKAPTESSKDLDVNSTFTNETRTAAILSRDRRSVDFDVDNIANQDWELNYTTPKSKSPFDEDSFQVITADDKTKAEAQRAKKILMYVGITLLSVLGFSALAFCFIKDPWACIIAFATGCPCCLLIVPCITNRIRKFEETSEEMLKENVNKYMPGIIIHEDGTIEHYQTTPEEVEAVMDIMDEMGVAP